MMALLYDKQMLIYKEHMTVSNKNGTTLEYFVAYINLKNPVLIITISRVIPDCTYLTFRI
jgi:hypothetical protein